MSGSGLGLEARAGVIFGGMVGCIAVLVGCGGVLGVWIQGSVGVCAGVVSVMLVREVIRRKRGALGGPG